MAFFASTWCPNWTTTDDDDDDDDDDYYYHYYYSCCPTNSVKALKALWPNCVYVFMFMCLC